MDEIGFLQDELEGLDEVDGLNFMVHLGNLVGPELGCTGSNYEQIAKMYGHSPVPVYVVPGEKEWRGCFTFLWRGYFSAYDEVYWPPRIEYTVDRQLPFNAENFAFLFRRILHIGINMLDDDESDASQSDRLDANLKWVEDSVEKYYDEADVIIMYGHSGFHFQNQMDFFLPLTNRMQNPWTWRSWRGKQFIYMYALEDGKWYVETQFWDVNNFSVVGVETKAWPPMRVRFDLDAEQGSFNQN